MVSSVALLSVCMCVVKFYHVVGGFRIRLLRFGVRWNMVFVLICVHWNIVSSTNLQYFVLGRG